MRPQDWSIREVRQTKSQHQQQQQQTPLSHSPQTHNPQPTTNPRPTTHDPPPKREHEVQNIETNAPADRRATESSSLSITKTGSHIRLLMQSEQPSKQAPAWVGATEPWRSPNPITPQPSTSQNTQTHTRAHTHTHRHTHTDTHTQTDTHTHRLIA